MDRAIAIIIMALLAFIAGGQTFQSDKLGSIDRSLDQIERLLEQR